MASSSKDPAAMDDNCEFEDLVVNGKVVGVGWVVQIMDPVHSWGTAKGEERPTWYILKEELGRSSSAVYLGVGVVGPTAERFNVMEEWEPVAVKLTKNGDRALNEMKRIEHVHHLAAKDKTGVQTRALQQTIIPTYLYGTFVVYEPRGDGTYHRRSKETTFRAVVQAVARPLANAFVRYPSYLEVFSLGANIIQTTHQLANVARHGDVKVENLATKVHWENESGRWERYESESIVMIDVEGIVHKDELSDLHLTAFPPATSSKSTLSVYFRTVLDASTDRWSDAEITALRQVIGNHSLSVFDDTWSAGATVAMLVNEFQPSEAATEMTRRLFPRYEALDTLYNQIRLGSKGNVTVDEVLKNVQDIWTQLVLLGCDSARTAYCEDLKAWQPILSNILQVDTPGSQQAMFLATSFEDCIHRSQRAVESRTESKYHTKVFAYNPATPFPQATQSATVQTHNPANNAPEIVGRFRARFSTRATTTSLRPTIPLLGPELRDSIDRKARQAQLEKRMPAGVAKDEEEDDKEGDELGGDGVAEEDAAAGGDEGAESSGAAEGSKGPRGIKRKLLEWKLVQRDEGRRVSLFEDPGSGKFKLEIDVHLHHDLPAHHKFEDVKAFRGIQLKYWRCCLPGCTRKAFKGENLFRGHLKSNACGWAGAGETSQWADKATPRTWAHPFYVIDPVAS